MASSSADVAAHGANMAVDGSSHTFWVRLLMGLPIFTSSSFAATLRFLPGQRHGP